MPKCASSLPYVALFLPALIAACAVLPDSGADASPKSVAAYATERSFAGSDHAWPVDVWWSSWGDPVLDGLITEALAGQPSLREAAARLAKAESKAALADAPMLPSVTLEGQAFSERLSQNYLYPPGSIPKNWRTYPQATANLSWELDLWGKNRAALAAALSEAEASRADAAQARLELSSALAGAWAEFARLWDARDTAASALDVRSKTLSLMQQRRTIGLENEIAVQRAQSRLDTARGDLAAADEQIALQSNAIAHLLGAGPDRGLSLPRPAINLTQAQGLPPQLAFNLLGRRPDIVAARLRVEASEKGIASAEASFYPDVNLAGLIGFQSLGVEKFLKPGSLYGSVGPALSLPIFDGGALRSQLHGARADRDLAVAAYDQTLNTALQEVADAAVSLKALDGRLSSAKAANAAADEAWRKTQARYAGGLATSLDALTAEDEMLSSRRPLTDLRARAFALDAQLARALGGGWQVAAKP